MSMNHLPLSLIPPPLFSEYSGHGSFFYLFWQPFLFLFFCHYLKQATWRLNVAWERGKFPHQGSNTVQPLSGNQVLLVWYWFDLIFPCKRANGTIGPHQNSLLFRVQNSTRHGLLKIHIKTVSKCHWTWSPPDMKHPQRQGRVNLTFHRIILNVGWKKCLVQTCISLNSLYITCETFLLRKFLKSRLIFVRQWPSVSMCNVSIDLFCKVPALFGFK